MLVFVLSLSGCNSSDETVKGLKIGNIDIGKMTAEELRELLNEKIEASDSVKIKYNDTEFEISLRESGVTVDLDKTVENAMNAGRSFKERFGEKKTDFVFEASAEQFKESITATLTELGLSEGSYSVTVSGNEAKFEINENSADPDTDALLDEIKEKYPELSETSEAIVLKHKDFVWPTAELIRDDFDSEAVDAYVDTSSGERKIVGHKEGRKIDFEALSKAIENKEKSFSVSYEVLKPSVYTDQLGEENFPTLLGKCVTKYNEGAVGRSSNIKLAASKINGYVMNKGAVFSFNGVVGKRTHAAGFKDAPVYTGSGVENGVGGGICQVSSTLYGAALEANMKIVSRTNHSYVVSYTVPGFDATVSYGSIDFKFSNPFDSPVKIKATASGGVMTVYIYGTKQNSNTVTLEHKILGTTARPVKRVYNSSLKVGSEVVTTAGYDGMKVQNYRHIKDASGNIIKTENLGVSNYITLAKVVEYNDGSGGGAQTPKDDTPPANEQTPVGSGDGESASLPVNPTQPNLQQDPEYSGNADPNAPLNTAPESDPVGELEGIMGE